MHDFYPYFTNDGTVGLFSESDDDIYHSTYGALSESWQKFIEPANLYEYIAENNDIKILDICYGIGYNTKAAIQTFLNFKKNNSKKQKKNSNEQSGIVAIDTDNTCAISESANFINNKNNFENNNKISNSIVTSNAALYTDNICGERFKKISIDAVETNNSLINLSPFITRKKRNFLSLNRYINDKYYSNLSCPGKFLQLQKLRKFRTIKLNKNYNINKEVPMIILESLNKDKSQIDDKIINSIMQDNYFSIFLSKAMLNFARFYYNFTYKTNKKTKINAFLHNIYYRYVSRRYKNAKKHLVNDAINLKFHNCDARDYVKQANKKYNFIFLDAFTPAKCPALWTLQFFEKLYGLLEDDGMILTYSNSAAVRNAFLQNGFCVGKNYDKNTSKYIGTIAAKNPNLIKYNLSEKDLAIINSKAGICYQDKDFNLDNSTIINNREIEVQSSDLISSSKAIKEYKCKIDMT